MFFQLLFIHLFRPFLKYKQAASPLPAHVSPRKFITHSATTISKLLRLYRRTYGLRQICNIVVYIAHTACTVHLLNLPDKQAQRDIQHGLNHLEEIAEGWLCARRTLGILHLVSRRWQIELPEAAAKTFIRTEGKFGSIRTPDHDFEPKMEASSPTSLDSIPEQIPANNNHNFPPQIYQPNPSFFPPSDQMQPSPMSTPDLPTHPHDNLTLPPQSPSDLSRLSRSHRYVVPQTQQPPQQSRPQKWQQQQQRAPSTSQPGVTSPTALFGGVQGLIQDQDWWLRDSNQFCANWNAGPQDENTGQMNGRGATTGQAAPGGGGIESFDWDSGEFGDARWDQKSSSVGGGYANMNGRGMSGGNAFGNYDFM